MPGLLYHLDYKLAADPQSLEFDNPAPVIWNAEPFLLTLANGMASIEMKERFASDGEARRRVEPFLRSWEIETGIQYGAGVMRFEFVDARVSDNETSTWRPPGGIRVTQVVLEVVYEVKKFREYPAPPQSFFADEDIQLMWQRLLGYKKDSNQLANMGYFSLTVAVGRAGSYAKAAQLYNVHPRVLKTLGELTTTRGSRTVARKYEKGLFRDHTTPERRWIEATVMELISRIGQVAANGQQPPSRLLMTDLPGLQ